HSPEGWSGVERLRPTLLDGAACNLGPNRLLRCRRRLRQDGPCLAREAFPISIELFEDAPVERAVPGHTLRHVVRCLVPAIYGQVAVYRSEVCKLEGNTRGVSEVRTPLIRR